MFHDLIPWDQWTSGPQQDDRSTHDSILYYRTTSKLLLSNIVPRPLRTTALAPALFCSSDALIVPIRVDDDPSRVERCHISGY